MDTPRTVAIVPPAGAQPLRTKSLRQQRASNGAYIIKAYVQQSEQRREQAKFHAAVGSRRVATASPRYNARDGEEDGDRRCEDSLRVPVSSSLVVSPHAESGVHSNQHAMPDDAHALDALFADRRVHRSRRTSIVALSPRRPSSQTDGSPHPQSQHETQGNGNVFKPLVRRRLQMESVAHHTTIQSAPERSSVGHHHFHHSPAYRPPAAAFTPYHPRTRHNLGAKLDALAKSSASGRRKVVVLATDDKGVKSITKGGVSRHANVSQPPVASSSSSANASTDGHSRSNGSHDSREPHESEIEMRVMAAFRQIVRLWRERKRKAEAAAVTKMNGSSNGIATGTGRNGSKLRKDLTAQSSNVVGIISRRLIREIPALKFFDDEADAGAMAAPTKTAFRAKPAPAAGVTAASTMMSSMAKTTATAMTPAMAAIHERAKPRGVCYTLDVFGCRKIKMQSSTTIATAASSSSSSSSTASQRNHQRTKSDESVTLEKAMSRSLHRKMARRVKSRRQAILKLGDEFSKSRRDLAMKLRSQLALQHAQIEKTFSTRLTLLMSDDASLPPYKAHKELQLARLRCKKAHLLEKCETLRVLGLVLKYVEAVGESTGVEVSTGELHFLDLFRCVVEENQVLTPIISDAIRQHMRAQDLKQLVVMELFRILNVEMHHN